MNTIINITMNTNVNKIELGRCREACGSEEPEPSLALDWVSDPDLHLFIERIRCGRAAGRGGRGVRAPEQTARH
jgi:hypothetical protein